MYIYIICIIHIYIYAHDALYRYIYIHIYIYICISLSLSLSLPRTLEGPLELTLQADHVIVDIQGVTLNNLMVRGSGGSLPPVRVSGVWALGFRD